jgi:hypothetical protein
MNTSAHPLHPDHDIWLAAQAPPDNVVSFPDGSQARIPGACLKLIEAVPEWTISSALPSLLGVTRSRVQQVLAVATDLGVVIKLPSGRRRMSWVIDARNAEKSAKPAIVVKPPRKPARIPPFGWKRISPLLDTWRTVGSIVTELKHPIPHIRAHVRVSNMLNARAETGDVIKMTLPGTEPPRYVWILPQHAEKPISEFSTIRYDKFLSDRPLLQAVSNLLTQWRQPQEIAATLDRPYRDIVAVLRAMERSDMVCKLRLDSPDPTKPFTVYIRKELSQTVPQPTFVDLYSVKRILNAAGVWRAKAHLVREARLWRGFMEHLLAEMVTRRLIERRGEGDAALYLDAKRLLALGEPAPGFAFVKCPPARRRKI